MVMQESTATRHDLIHDYDTGKLFFTVVSQTSQIKTALLACY